MGLENTQGKRITFVNISTGKLYTKEAGKEPVFYTELTAFITKVDFRTDEYNGQNFEVAEFNLFEDGVKYVLKVRTDSGYFRGLANSLKSGNPKEKFTIIPNYKEEDGKTKTTCFVKQNGISLKHAHTKANMGDLPQATMVMYKGKEVVDSTNQINYWKKFLTNADWYKLDIQDLIPEPNLVPLAEELPPNIEDEDDYVDDLPF